MSRAAKVVQELKKRIKKLAEIYGEEFDLPVKSEIKKNRAGEDYLIIEYPAAPRLSSDLNTLISGPPEKLAKKLFPLLDELIKI